MRNNAIFLEATIWSDCNSIIVTFPNVPNTQGNLIQNATMRFSLAGIVLTKYLWKVLNELGYRLTIFEKERIPPNIREK